MENTQNSQNDQNNQSQAISNQPAQTQSPWAVPMAIVIAGLLIAGAVFYKNPSGQNTNVNNLADTKTAQQNNASLESMDPITNKDHILGNSDAPVKIVEYSDPECPFCKRFHETMQQVMSEYGASGKVAWVYRHFPLDSLHPKAKSEAEATECAYELGGDAKFWEYMNRLMEITPSNNGLDPAQLPEIAKYVKLDTAAFNKCLGEHKHLSKIEANTANAIATGGQGTPWSILVAKNGKKYPINGALPYSQVKALIDQSL